MTKAQALALGITLCRWRHMQYRTERGKQRLATYRQNAFHATKHATELYHMRHPDYITLSNFKDPTATPEIERALKQALERLRQLKLELNIMHCAEMRKIHSVNAAARRAAKAMISVAST